MLDIGSAVELTVWRDRKREPVSIAPIEWPNMTSPVEAAMAPPAMAAMASVPDTSLKVVAISDTARHNSVFPHRSMAYSLKPLQPSPNRVSKASGQAM